jgi:serine/threonine-protein kinase RsbT
VKVRERVRRLAREIGFDSTTQIKITTAISEVTRNIISYAGHGEVSLRLVQDGSKRGISIVAHDEGPGIADIFSAMQDGYSTSGGLGLGLPGSKRLMDEFEVVSAVGKGTTITMKKWVR